MKREILVKMFCFLKQLSIEFVKSIARPDYWQPDEECMSCLVCNKPFSSRRSIHHCRSCGQGVCAHCSRHNQPVPTRGLDFPCRVCDQCYQANVPNSQLLAPRLDSMDSREPQSLHTTNDRADFINRSSRTKHNLSNCTAHPSFNSDFERRRKNQS